LSTRSCNQFVRQTYKKAARAISFNYSVNSLWVNRCNYKFCLLSLSRTEYWIYVLQQTLSKNSKLTQTETHKSIPKNPTNWNPEIKRNGMLIPYWTQTQVAFSERGCNQRRNQCLQSQKSNEINTQRFGDLGFLTKSIWDGLILVLILILGTRVWFW
jgi:hypothetical protein